MQGRGEELTFTFEAQGVVNTLWAYATMGRVPKEGLMRAREGRGELAEAGTFNVQGVVHNFCFCKNK